MIFKGATVHGINGRRMYETWLQAGALLLDRKLDLSPVITHRLPLAKFDEAMHLSSQAKPARSC